jgi:hypothetical protein
MEKRLLLKNGKELTKFNPMNFYKVNEYLYLEIFKREEEERMEYLIEQKIRAWKSTGEV